MKTKLDLADIKFILYLFFTGIFDSITCKSDSARFKFVIMKLTASGKFEKRDANKEDAK